MKKTALLFALIFSLTFNVSNGFAADNHHNEKKTATSRVATEDEIRAYLLANHGESLLLIRSLEGTEDVITYAVSGSVFYVEIEDGVIIKTTEMPNN